MAKAQAKEKEEEVKDEENEISSEMEVEIEGEKKPEPKKEEAKDEEKDDDKDEEKDGVQVDDPERDAIRERRRAERADRKERQRDREEQKDREIAALRDRLNRVERASQETQTRTVKTDLQSIENGMRGAVAELREAEEIIKKGVAEQNGEAVAAANRAMLEAQRKYDYLDNMRQRMAQQAKRPPEVDPLVKRGAESWMSKHTWYNPQGTDQDSKVVLTIDQAMADDGWDPREPRYWEELGKRVEKYLPHRKMKNDIEDEEEVKGSPTGGSGKESPSSNKVRYTVSQARVEVLKESGDWDRFQSDAKFRARMVARFKEADQKYGGK